MAKTGSATVWATDHNWLTFLWTVTAQSIENNTSTISWELYLGAGAHGAIYSSASKRWLVNINGIEYSGYNEIGIANNATKTLARGITVIPHNADGTKTFSYNFSQQFDINFSGGWIAIVGDNGSGVIDTIPRQAILTGAPNFNDEENPTITYSNPAGSAVTSLQACISWTGADDIKYRDIPKTGGSYTFELTEAEREALRNATTTSNSRNVIFYVTTVVSGLTYRSTLSKTFSITNAAPTLAPTVIDAGTGSTNLTGNPNTMIKGFNSMRYTIGATTYKGASIKSQSIQCGSRFSFSNSGVLEYVDSNEFIFTVTDSRGNIATKTITLPMIPYSPLTATVEGDIKVSAADSTKAELEFTISGNYYNGSFGAVDNTLTVAYTIEAGESGGGIYYEEVTIPADQITDNRYSITLTKTDLDYNNSYTVVAEVSDAITKKLKSTSKVFRALPVFDWDKESFNFNVPITLNNKPLDYVVEQNTNGIWFYKKWDSGLAELWGKATSIYGAAHYLGSYHAFPFTLVEWYSALGVLNNFTGNLSTYLTTNAKVEMIDYNGAYYGCNIWVQNSNNSFQSGDTGAVSVYIVGRWK